MSRIAFVDVIVPYLKEEENIYCIPICTKEYETYMTQFNNYQGDMRDHFYDFDGVNFPVFSALKLFYVVEVPIFRAKKISDHF